MKNPLSEVPFLFLLISLIIGILLQYFLSIQYLSIASLFAGTIAMLFSFFIPFNKQFSLRWVFGAGSALFIAGVGMVCTSFKQEKSEYTFSKDNNIYLGIVTDSPQKKAKTVAYKVHLPNEDKQIVCYLQFDSLTKEMLQPGEEFLFYGKIQTLKNTGNPNDFDYVRYMHNQGFSGSAYIPVNSWKSTNNISTSFKYTALRYRQKIMDFYKSLGLDETEYTILSALTLGYQDELSEDLKQGFRTTGTVHVLSVSGLHVGIIYLMISFLLGFIHKGSKYHWVKPVLIILFLWFYAFITGLPPSVIRASAMLTILCISEIFGKRSYPIHTLFIAIFFILLFSPLTLFDIGFQLSFMSVLSILYLHPKVSTIVKTDNKLLKYIWLMVTLSFVAQLATFPICLYHFGTFPTYFFITNLLIVPLVTFIIYSVGAIFAAKLFCFIIPTWGDYFFYLPVKILQILVNLMTSVIRFFENLPFALIENLKISFSDLILIFAFISCTIVFLIYRKNKACIAALVMILIFSTTHIYQNIFKENRNLIVYNKKQNTEIICNKKVFNLKDINEYEAVTIQNKKILIVTTPLWHDNEESHPKLNIDHLILANDNSLSIDNLEQHLCIKNVILDVSLSSSARNRISKECQKLNIPYYDIVENGAFSLIF